ncbi:hypothetical protein PIB30_098496 [Stylosanthes scabra]|uniref:Uncharacterized protein n=1 Tax=Stylosanthes scabra TaxID=79078 RepID=A0ABU6UXD0_9FABA|nr:hypothetical protein [Stylosanthes scabra]
MAQLSRDHQAGRLLAWRIRLDCWRVEDWIRSRPKIHTWCSLVSIVWHVDRVMRQLVADQPVPTDSVNVDLFLTITGRGEDVAHTSHHKGLVRELDAHATNPVVIDVVLEPNFRGTRKYLDWWPVAWKGRFLSHYSLMCLLAGVAEEGEQGAQAELFVLIDGLGGRHPPHRLEPLDRGGLLTERGTRMSLRRRSCSTSSRR